jgi:hypothetical protein
MDLPMTKYARPIPVGNEVRTIDVVDTAAYEPRPEWGQTDDALLERLFAPQLEAQWKAAGQWFVEVCAGVQPGATHTGSDFTDPASFLNPDGTDGNGNAIPPAVQPVEEPVPPPAP